MISTQECVVNKKFISMGCTHVLVDAFSTLKPVKIQTKKGPRTFYYIHVLFGRKKDDGTYSTKRRQVAVSYKPDSEFNWIIGSLWKDQFTKPSKDSQFDYVTYIKGFISDIRAHTYNLKIQWYDHPHGYPVMQSCSPSTSKTLMVRDPAMLWKKEGLQHKFPFPELEARNQALLKLLSSPPQIDDDDISESNMNNWRIDK